MSFFDFSTTSVAPGGATATVTGLDLASVDYSPLAWVLVEIQKALDGAIKSLRRQARESASGGSADLGLLRLTKQQLHQAVGALQMVGHPAPALVLGAIEFTAHGFIAEPWRCDDAAVDKVERAGSAMIEYLQALLAGKTVSSVALFPQYRELLELTKSGRIHPADLWPQPWRWVDVELPSGPAPLGYDPAVRSRLDSDVLKVLKSGDVFAARRLHDLSLGLAHGTSERNAASFWVLAAAFFEALALALIPDNVYAKRAASRVLLQYAALAQGELNVPEALAHDLLFFCSQAQAEASEQAATLRAVRSAWGIAGQTPVDYTSAQFGRFAPLVLTQARQRIEAAKETWSALAGGDLSRISQVVESFAQLGESLQKLHPPSLPMAQALSRAVDASLHSGQSPSTGLAMEVATSVLYLEAAFEDLDPNDPQLTVRAVQLAARINRSCNGGPSEPLEAWMEELYRRVSDRRVLGTVVDQLRSHVVELEKSLDQYFRHPADTALLQAVPNQLLQIAGVFSVLGLDHAVHTVTCMRGTVDQLLSGETSVEFERDFDSLGNNLGVLGFLIDMLGYQPASAKHLFVFDEQAGELKPLMDRQIGESEPDPRHGFGSVTNLAPLSFERAPLSGDAADADLTARLAALANPDQPLSSIEEFSRATAGWTSKIAGPALLEASPETEVTELEEDDLNDIFLSEAREVLLGAMTAVAALAHDAGDHEQQTVLRRAFHTLKGSSRMVGLTEFSNATFSFEQLLSTWLTDQRPPTLELLVVLRKGLHDFGQWVQAIASGEPHAWRAESLQEAADALRKLKPSPARQPLPELTGVPYLTDVGFPPMSVEDMFGAEIGRASNATMYQDEDEFSSKNFVDFGAPAESQSITRNATALSPVGIDGFDFSVRSDAQESMDSELTVRSLADEFADAEPRRESQPTSQLELDAMPLDADDAVKTIGSLRIGVVLYNVYLNEADESSRRLANELGEWALEPHSRVPDSTLVLAHSLAGSSATVGFHGLSSMARLVESALQQLSLQGLGTPESGAVMVAAANELRHMLHQFTAGFLRDPEPSTLEALRQVATGQLPTAAPAQPIKLSLVVAPVEQIHQAEAIEFDGAFAHVQQTSTAVSAPERWLEARSRFGQRQPDDHGDVIDVQDAVDAELFPVFEEEAAELLPKLGMTLRAWAEDPHQAAPRASILRSLHTLKGSARLAGAMRLGERAHGMESEIELIGAQSVTRADVDTLLDRFDLLQATFDSLRADDTASQVAIAQQVAEAAAMAPEIVDSNLGDTVIPEVHDPADGVQANASQGAAGSVALQASSLMASLRPASGQAVRIRTQLLDRLVAQAGEVIITRTRLEANLGLLRTSLHDLTGNLERIRQQLRDLELQAEGQMQSRLAQTKDSQQGFDPLEFDRFTRVQELTRMMAESVNDVATVQATLQRTVQSTEDDLTAQARQTRELQRGLLRTRMVEFEDLSERLYRVVRQAAKDANKRVRLDITGGWIEMDRGVLDRMTPAFEHLLRNSVAHGIENAEQRTQAGKDPIGVITVALHHEGNDVSVSFHDDGAGLDYQRIAQRARSLSLVDADRDVTPEEAVELILRPGFSTAPQVSELSGRGIGMDVVRAKVAALGGRIETHSSAGQGTTFKLVLPLTTAVTHVVMLRAGAVSIGVPSTLIELIQRASTAELNTAYARQTYNFAGEDLPFFWAGALLQSSPRSEQPVLERANTVVVVRSAAQRIVLHVDEVLGNQEVVVKNLGPQLARLPGMAGITVLASGAVALIYNPVALATVHGERARQLQSLEMASEGGANAPSGASDSGAALAPARELTPLILVVDDSITVRRVTQRLLLREGYRVTLAVDGLQALERLQQERPAVVLSDIEMPRMDGFDLARNIRADAALKGLPIIMITSRIAEKHREHAKQLGVDHYLGKPYSEEELLRLVRSYTSAAR